MTTKPSEISLAEWAEIMRVPQVKEGWGIPDDETPESFSSYVYGVKFSFMSGGPGYSGYLFILQGDGLEPPLQLVRRKSVLECVSERS